MLDASLAKRTGSYDQYHHGHIDVLHISYFRRKPPKGRAFTRCNMRKSYGAVLGDGRIGFRQMAPLIAEYAELQSHRIENLTSKDPRWRHEIPTSV